MGPGGSENSDPASRAICALSHTTLQEATQEAPHGRTHRADGQMHIDGIITHIDGPTAHTAHGCDLEEEAACAVDAGGAQQAARRNEDHLTQITKSSDIQCEDTVEMRETTAARHYFVEGAPGNDARADGRETRIRQRV